MRCRTHTISVMPAFFSDSNCNSKSHYFIVIAKSQTDNWLLVHIECMLGDHSDDDE